MELFKKIGLVLLTGILLFYVGYSLIRNTYSIGDEVLVNSTLDFVDKYTNAINEMEITSDLYEINDEDNYIYIGTRELYLDKIDTVNCVKEINDDKLLIKIDDKIIKEYKVVGIRFNNYQVFGKNIVNVIDDNYEDFVANIVCSDGITYKIYNGEDEVTNGIISDSMNLEVFYDNKIVDKYIISEDFLNFSDNLEIDDVNTFIGRIDANTSVDTFLNKVHASAEFRILDKNDNAISSGDIIKTGDKFTVTFANQLLIYKFSIIGDVTEDGIVGGDDVNLISKHILKGNLFIDAECLKSADYDNNNVVDINDVIKIAKNLKDSGDVNE